MPLSRNRASEPDDDDDFTDENEEPETPRRGLGNRVRGKAETAFKQGVSEARGASHDDDDDDDDDAAPTSNVVRRGWAAARKLKSTGGGGFAREFRFDQDETLVKFIEDEPFAVFAQHWVEGLKTTNKKSFICLGKGCPLCAIGDSPRQMFAFNIAVIDGSEVDVQSLLAGVRLLGQIETAHSGKSGPLSKGFWSLSRSGKKQQTSYALQAVKARDLKDDWAVDLDDIEAELADLKGFGPEAYKPLSRSELRDIAEEIAAEQE